MRLMFFKIRIKILKPRIKNFTFIGSIINNKIQFDNEIIKKL